MKKLIFFTIFLFMFCFFSVKASECSNDDRKRLQVLAKNINYIIEPSETNDNVIFSAIFSGVSQEIRIFSEQKAISIYNFSDNYIGETVMPYLYPGKTYNFIIYGKRTCVFEKIREIIINTPSFNKYYNDPICNDAREYKLCQKWYNMNLSYDEFISSVNSYIITKSRNNDVKNEEGLNKSFDFMSFYKRFYWPTFIGMFCILGLLITLWIRENKKNKL